MPLQINIEDENFKAYLNGLLCYYAAILPHQPDIRQMIDNDTAWNAFVERVIDEPFQDFLTKIRDPDTRPKQPDYETIAAELIDYLPEKVNSLGTLKPAVKEKILEIYGQIHIHEIALPELLAAYANGNPAEKQPVERLYCACLRWAESRSLEFYHDGGTAPREELLGKVSLVIQKMSRISDPDFRYDDQGNQIEAYVDIDRQKWTMFLAMPFMVFHEFASHAHAGKGHCPRPPRKSAQAPGLLGKGQEKKNTRRTGNQSTFGDGWMVLVEELIFIDSAFDTAHRQAIFHQEAVQEWREQTVTQEPPPGRSSVEHISPPKSGYDTATMFLRYPLQGNQQKLYQISAGLSSLPSDSLATYLDGGDLHASFVKNVDFCIREGGKTALQHLLKQRMPASQLALEVAALKGKLR